MMGFNPVSGLCNRRAFYYGVLNLLVILWWNYPIMYRKLYQGVVREIPPSLKTLLRDDRFPAET